MKIELINSSKLKISFNKIDLDDNNISIHNFLSRSQISQNFIKAIIEIALEDFGFDIKNNDFTYEIYCFNFFDFTIILSKQSHNISNNNLKYKTFKNNNFSNLPSFTFGKNKLLKSENLLFFFNNFEDFLNFSIYINKTITFKNVNSILYEYNNIYLLEIITSSLLENELNILFYNSIEAKSNKTISRLNLVRFKEFANILLPENALNL